MKIVSILFRLAALAAAGVCVFAWFDSRGKMSAADANLTEAGIKGDTLVDKSAAVLDLSKAHKKALEAGKAKDEINKNHEGKIAALNSELEGERTKNVQVSGDLSKRQSELRTANTQLAAAKKQIAEKNATIESLKKEIVSTKSMLTQGSANDESKGKLEELETQLAAKTKELEDALQKLKILEQGEVVQIVEVDPLTGEKVIRKVIKTPYVPKGDIATVLEVDLENGVVVLNKSEKDGFQVEQKLLLLREGKTVAEISVLEVIGNQSSALFNRKIGIPETLEVGDQLEISSPAAVAVQDSNPADI